MRIVIASQTYTYGNGQASFTIRLAENLAQRGHQVMVLTPSETMKSYGIDLNGVRVEKIPALHLSILHPAIYFTPFPTPRVKQLLREFQPDVVHIQDHYFLCSAVAREARRNNIPTIGTNHFLPENLLPFLRRFPKLQQLAAFLLWKMMLFVFNRLDTVTTPSNTAAKILHGQKIRVPVRAISNGVDTARFHPDPEIDRAGIRRKYNLNSETPLFLYMGRLDGEKRIDVLIEAIAQLPDADFQLAIGGYGSHESFLRKLAQTLGLEKRVNFIGYVTPEDLPSLYNSADVFVMPSPEELQSIATLEAMACGKPILASDSRALPELVNPGENGYLFQPNNPSDAARMMNQLLNKCSLWNSMGRASFESIQSHSLQNTLMRYEDQYKLIMEQVQLWNTHPSLRKVPNKSYQRDGV